MRTLLTVIFSSYQLLDWDSDNWVWNVSFAAGGCVSRTCIVQLQLMDSVERLTLQTDKCGRSSTSQCQYYRICSSWRWGHSQHKSISECHFLPKFICRQRRSQAFCPSWPVVNWKFWSYQPPNFVVGQGCSNSWINGKPLIVNNMVKCKEKEVSYTANSVCLTGLSVLQLLQSSRSLSA